MYKKLYYNDRTLPRAYGLLKIHKDGCSLRIIILSIDSPLYSLASFLHNIIKDNVPKLSSHINNSIKLVEKLNGF